MTATIPARFDAEKCKTLVHCAILLTAYVVTCEALRQSPFAILLAPGVALLAAFVASDRARELRDMVRAALTRIGMSDKEASFYLRQSEQQTCHQLALRQPTNFYRWADLPDEFWDAFVEIRAERRGRRVLGEGALLRLVDSVQLLVASQPKPMVRMTLPETAAEKERA